MKNYKKLSIFNKKMNFFIENFTIKNIKIIRLSISSQ